MSRKFTSSKVSRRVVLAGTAVAAAAALTRFQAPAIAQTAPFKLGLLTVKTGPLAEGGIQMEQGVVTYLKEKNYTMGGRKVTSSSPIPAAIQPAPRPRSRNWLNERKSISFLVPLPVSSYTPLANTSFSTRCRRSVLRQRKILRSANQIRICCAHLRRLRRLCSPWDTTPRRR